MWSKMKKNLLLMPLENPEKDFTKIEENLFLGNISFAQNQYSLKKYDISLIIAVYPKSLIGLSVQLIPPECRFHHIDVRDSSNEDLISHFDNCYALINEELTKNDGSVLVYCGAGFSRSVTITAAYLMRKYRITAEEAVERIRSLRHRINPNPGFLAQLKLYEDMNFHLDKTNAEYRVFALIILKKQIWNDKYWADSPVAQLNRQFCDPMRYYLIKVSFVDNNGPKKSNIHYKCVKCNHILFEEINVLTINETPNKVEDNNCDKIFIEPIKWLVPLLCTTQRGDVNCPKCDTPLGHFKWKAFKCVCDSHSVLSEAKIIKIFNTSVKKCFDN